MLPNAELPLLWGCPRRASQEGTCPAGSGVLALATALPPLARPHLESTADAHMGLTGPHGAGGGWGWGVGCAAPAKCGVRKRVRRRRQPTVHPSAQTHNALQHLERITATGNPVTRTHFLLFCIKTVPGRQLRYHLCGEL